MRRIIKELDPDMRLALAAYDKPVTMCEPKKKRFKMKLPDRMRPMPR